MKKFKIFINQFNSPLIYILFVACFISFYLKEFIDGFIILFVIFINGIVGFIQEIRADDALEALKKMSSPHCYIKENGKIKKILSNEIKVNDILVLQEGDIVAADAIIIDNHGLKIDESSLTGEAIRVEKDKNGLDNSNKVFESLIASAIETKDILKKYYDLKSKVLKIDKCAPWGTQIELYETDKEYTIEEACDLVSKALEPLGEDYVNHFKHVIEDRCVDFCQYKGKCSGGYNISSPDMKNSKILMSFNYDLQSVSTLAHESGHHVHHQYLCENNFEEYRHAPSIISEVASLTNEFLLSNYLINNGSREEALSGLSNILGTFENNFYGGVQEGNLEQEFYKHVEDGGTLTKEYLYDLCEKSLLKFYPNEIQSNYEKCAWITRSHYYMFYYLFSYSICISVASYVSKEILSGNKEMLDKYISFLKTGSDHSVSDVYKVLGIDLENKNVYLDAIDNFSSLIDKFDEIYNK